MTPHTSSSSSSSTDFPWPTSPSSSTYKNLSPPSIPSHALFCALQSSLKAFLCTYTHSCMDPISMEKIRAMNKYSKSRRHQLQLPTLSLYMAATFVFCLLLTSPAWFPRLCSALGFFFLTTLPDLVTAFLLSPKCLFVVGNLIIAFLVGESMLAPRRDDDGQPSMVNEIHEEHEKKNTAMMVATAKETDAAAEAVAATADHSAFVGAAVVEETVEAKEEEGEEEELHKRVEDFIARVKKQRKLELKSFFDVDR